MALVKTFIKCNIFIGLFCKVWAVQNVIYLKDNRSMVLYPFYSAATNSEKTRLLSVLREIEGELLVSEIIPDCDDTSNPSICWSSEMCMTLHDSTGYALNDSVNSKESLNCSLLVYDRSNAQSGEEEEISKAAVWGFGILSVGIISLSGLIGAILFPLLNSKYYEHVMVALIGLAVGTLTSSSIFQLIPQGFGFAEGEQTHLLSSAVMVSSIWALYMFEVLCKIFFYQPLGEPSPSKQPFAQEVLRIESLPGRIENDDLLPGPHLNRSPVINEHLAASSTSLHKISPLHLHSHNAATKSEKHGKLSPVACMVIFGDGLHNFIDGMSIGAGYSRSLKVGFSISVAIACEEFPHELGDFAILVNSGMKVKKALLFNFLSALTAFFGLIFGVLIGETKGNSYVFIFAGGLFLYISLTDLMSEMRNTIQKELNTSKRKAFVVLLLQNCGLLFGVSLVSLISAAPLWMS